VPPSTHYESKKAAGRQRTKRVTTVRTIQRRIEKKRKILNGFALPLVLHIEASITYSLNNSTNSSNYPMKCESYFTGTINPSNPMNSSTAALNPNP